jgi:P4 family phage/plasmid primase-like protien
MKQDNLIKPLVPCEKKVQLIKPLVPCEQKVQLISPLISCEQKVQLISPLISCEQKVQLISPLVPYEQNQQPQITNVSIGNESSLQEAGVILPLCSSQFPATNNAASVYMPEPKPRSEFIECTRKSINARDIAEIVKMTVLIKSKDGELFVFDRGRGIYERYEDWKMKQLMHLLVKSRLEEIESPDVFSKAIDWLRCDYTIVAQELELPKNVWVFKNVFVNIYTGHTEPNDGHIFITSALQCDYDRKTRCPLFGQFLSSITGGDQRVMELLLKIIGYTLSPDMDAKCFFTFCGEKDTGKSVMAHLIQSFFPEESVSYLGMDKMGGNFAMEDLLDKFLNVCTDMSDKVSTKAVGQMKSLIRGDRIRTDRKFKSSKVFCCRAKFLILTDSIQMGVSDEAFLKMQIVVPFRYPVPKDKQDHELLHELQQELSGIALMAMEAYKRLVENHYVFPDTSFEQLPDGMKYNKQKVMKSFITKKCDFSIRDAKTSSEDLHNAYNAYCVSEKVPMTSDKKLFSAEFKKCVGDRVTHKKVNIDGKSVQGYVGVSLRFR